MLERRIHYINNISCFTVAFAVAGFLIYNRQKLEEAQAGDDRFV
jgi:UDP-N-acetylmuramyl pentapeptide phosphotransferase/UDP-N-acetylglucosamine-1-phosphate transferase